MIRASDRKPFLLEMNTSPGMTGHSLVPQSAKAAGISYEDLCLRLLAGATLDSHPPPPSHEHRDPVHPLPPDVRVTQFTTLVVAAAVAGCCWPRRRAGRAPAAVRLRRHPAGGRCEPQQRGQHPGQHRAKLTGNFFTLDLQSARQVFESLPWVRHAVVQRVWPNRLEVTLEEHKPAAVWKGDEGNDRLVNTYGEVFEANVGDVDDDDLPEFSGDEASAPEMLAMYRRLNPVFAPLGLEWRGWRCPAAAPGRPRWTTAPWSRSAAAATRKCWPAAPASCAPSPRPRPACRAAGARPICGTPMAMRCA
jgi:hypothetical protein